VYARIANPLPGDWKMVIDSGGADSRFTAKAYVLNRINSLAVSARWPTRKPGEEMYIFAFPRSKGGSITQPGTKLTARVSRPDGSSDTLDLFDSGRDGPDHGDDIPGDGVYTGVYKNTGLKGAYGFQVSGQFEKWGVIVGDPDQPKEKVNVPSPKFLREVRVSAAIGDPGDHPTNPEDTPQNPPRDWCKLCCWLAIFFFILFLIALYLLWRCCWRKRAQGRLASG
jgi:hypothetical protein